MTGRGALSYKKEVLLPAGSLKGLCVQVMFSTLYFFTLFLLHFYFFYFFKLKGMLLNCSTLQYCKILIKTIHQPNNNLSKWCPFEYRVYKVFFASLCWYSIKEKKVCVFWFACRVHVCGWETYGSHMMRTNWLQNFLVSGEIVFNEKTDLANWTRDRKILLKSAQQHLLHDMYKNNFLSLLYTNFYRGINKVAHFPSHLSNYKQQKDHKNHWRSKKIKIKNWLIVSQLQ